MRVNWKRPRGARLAGLAAAAVVGVLAMVFTPLTRVLVEWISGPDWRGMDGAARSAALGQLRLALVQVAAALGAAIALLFTAFNYRLTRRGQVTDRFTKALERLGSDQMYVRIGGVLALEQIVHDAPDQATHAAQVLVAFIRERAPRAAKRGEAGKRGRLTAARRSARNRVATPTRSPELPREPDADVQAALTALTRPTFRAHVESGGSKRIIDLSDLHLTRVRLKGADLSNVDLGGADLTSSGLLEVDLSDSRLWRVNLTHAWLEGANLTRAWAREAELSQAKLKDADLTSARLGSADLTDADLTGACLKDADLRDLALFPDAPHRGETNLTDAILCGADLGSAVVSVEQILLAKLDRHSKLPVEMADDPRIKAFEGSTSADSR
ncbi:pentapeptide repeat-containing protein [Streptomyces sp. NBC_00154]|uniref:pentapeptide repeat-containing protein n=1 Tax=Streptomyces sp. NBC_00154 TaxID=2975670 RepID=UPI0022544CDC|nr:pentapeptide repeat-containing protein [Streptomyces sp. NBC_00154]MCX5310688.1 pentapeptide repeat-containing protein [Streptomyces sp. NBC_00154]